MDIDCFWNKTNFEVVPLDQKFAISFFFYFLPGKQIFSYIVYKCTATLLYIVFKKGDIIMTLGNDNAGNFSKCVILCSVNMICLWSPY
jgi:hypothetical protein